MNTEEFITAHRTDDVRMLALRGCPDAAIDMPYALDQIAGWQTARAKLPSLAATDGIVFPPHLSMEQCSSEATACYKARLMARLVTEAGVTDTARTAFADLTGGFGIDFMYMSRQFGRATYVERDERLCRLASHNFSVMGMANAGVVCTDGAAFLKQTQPLTAIFLDPARRDSHGAKTVAIADCTPDAAALRPLLTAKAAVVMVKLSPMLDWHKAVADMHGAVTEVHIVATGGECKELLLVMTAGGCGDVRLVCANDDAVFATTEQAMRMPCPIAAGDWAAAATDGSPTVSADEPLWLYEPNAAVMKAGAFGAVAEAFGLEAVAANSHLFVSRRQVDGFPGRRFRMETVCGMNKKVLRKRLAGISKANVAVRNFPLTAEALRRRLALTDGGDTYIFGTTTAAKSHVIMVGKRF